MYEYRATILRVVDGDTVEAQVDLGFNVFVVQTFRLYGINAPETKGESRLQGIESRKYLSSLISQETGASFKLLIQTKKSKQDSDRQEKYGRYLAVLIADGINLNLAMVNAGQATPYMVDE